MPFDLSDDARELAEHFEQLPEEDRARVLALVRSLCLCRIVEVYSTPRRSPGQGSGTSSMSSPVREPCV